jgi:hypothetical protein
MDCKVWEIGKDGHKQLRTNTTLKTVPDQEAYFFIGHFVDVPGSQRTQVGFGGKVTAHLLENGKIHLDVCAEESAARKCPPYVAINTQSVESKETVSAGEPVRTELIRAGGSRYVFEVRARIQDEADR